MSPFLKDFPPPKCVMSFMDSYYSYIHVENKKRQFDANENQKIRNRK